MASSNSSRSGGSRRSPTTTSSNSQPLIFGAIGLVVVVAVVVLMNQKGDSPSDSGQAKTPAASKSAAAPMVPGASATQKAGKTAKRPAPPLSAETLAKIRSSRSTAEGFYNEGVTARTAGDNATARDKQAKAKAALDNLDVMLKEPLLWQEEAQIEGWAQPAEYVTLEKEYGEVMKLTKRIRMGGGK